MIYLYVTPLICRYQKAYKRSRPDPNKKHFNISEYLPADSNAMCAICLFTLEPSDKKTYWEENSFTIRFHGLNFDD